MKIIHLSLLVFGVLFLSKTSAQESVSSRKQQTEYLKNQLAITPQVAGKVDSILLSYKEGINKVSAETNLDEKAKRVKIDQLIDEKNRKLSAILSREQLRKIVPTTELKE